MKTMNHIVLNAVDSLLAFSSSSMAVSINPTSRNFTKDGGGGAVIVTTAVPEYWTATSDRAWLNVTPTTSGTGNGTVAYLVSANLSADNRSGKVTIGGQIHAVNQSGYASAINPLSAAYTLAGGTGVINVTVDAGISWSAVSDSAWCRITAGSSGSGSGTTFFTVAANTDVATRFANISIAGQVFTISQAGTDVLLKPSTAAVGPDTSFVQFDINALSATLWTVSSQVDWIYPLGLSSGSGAASITLTVVRNSSWQPRVGTVQVGSALLTIRQMGVLNPAYSITPTSVTAPSAGAAGAIAVSATMDAPWAVTSNVPWVIVVAGASGAGNGGVRYVVSQNPSPAARTGRVVLSGSGPQQDLKSLFQGQLSDVGYLSGSPSLLPNAPSTRPNNPDGRETYFNATTSAIAYPSPWNRTSYSCTYSFWFRTDFAGRTNRLFMLENSYKTKLYTATDGRLRLDGGWGSLSPVFWIQANQWYHIILCQSSSALSMWLDGQQVASYITLDALDPFSGSSVRFGGGGSIWGTNNFYQGSIDDYRCWDRALSDPEILMLYATEAAGKSTPTNAITYTSLTHTITQSGAVGLLSATATNFPAAGGSGAVSLTIGSAAVWSVSSDSAWLTLVTTNSGFGNATINYSVAPSSTIYNRFGTLTIAAIPYVVTQTGRGVSVTGGPFGFGTDGGLGSFNIASENNAAWSVVNDNPWITITTGGSGTAPATCMFVVSPYGSPLVARTGFLYVGTNAIAVTQSGYTASVSPLVNLAAANGGSQSVTVSVPAGAIWSAISRVPWITIIGGQSQSGSGNLTYIISGNAGGTRSGTIIVAGEVVTVTQNSANPGSVVNLYVGSESGRQGQQVVVPISGVNFSNIQTAQFTVKWDYASLQYVGVEQYGLAGLNTANFGFPTAGTMTFSWEHPTLDSASLASNTPLFAVRFSILGTPGASTQVRLDSQPTLVELTDMNGNPTVVVSTNGWVKFLNTYDISGSMKYQGSQFYVSNAVFTASGDLVATTNSGTGNSYMFSVTNGANVTISASKTTDTSPSAGISTADIVLIRRHIMGLATFIDPYQLLAADANGSGTVTTADISSLRKLILAITNALPAGMWQVFPSDYLFQNPMLPWNPPNYRQYYSVAGSYSGQHFVAIKVGDVDGSWTNTAGASGTPQKVVTHPKGAKSLPLLSVSSGKTNPTGNVNLNIVVTNFTGVTGIQFSMDWDPALLSYAGITTGGLPLFGSGNIGVTYTSAGKLAIAWDDIYGTGVTLPDGTNLFQVNFAAKGVSGTSSVNISDVPTMREVVFGTMAQTPTTADGRVVIASIATPPIIFGQSVSNNVFTVLFGYTPGVTYGIDYSTNLIIWLPASNPQIIINGSTARWSDDGILTGGFGGRKFYRVNAR